MNAGLARNAFFVACAFVSCAVYAGERVPLWPAGRMPDAQAHQIAAMTDEAGRPGFKADEHRAPYVEWFDPPAPEKRKNACMVLISGGSYQCCCDVGLIKLWRERFTEMGFQCVNLVYRTPRPKGLAIHQSAWEDGQRAIRVVRSEAKRRGFDPEKIGAISMSAGSHLNTLLATSSLTPAYARVDALDDVPCHVNFAITCAIAYGVTDGAGCPNTRDGDAPDAKIDPAFKFDAKTAPMCMFHGGMDVYSPMSSTLVYRQLRRMKIPAELHLFADRSHGFFGSPKGDAGAAYDNWFDRAAEFIRQMNFLGDLGPEIPQAKRESAEFTASVEREALWPKGRIPDLSPNQKYEPYMEWYVPKTLKTKAIQVVTPGGGYNFCNVAGEGVPVAHYFNKKGMTAVVVNYRCPRPQGGLAKHLSGWQDAQRAIRKVRAEAPARGLAPNRIGVMGFSAGGHLTIMAATSSRHRSYLPVDEIDRQSCKVQWACPTYPAYALTDGADCPNVKGGNEDDAVPVPEFSFDLDTPPMCFQHGDADGWAAMNSVKTWEKLRRMGIQSDLHTLARRGHCFQFNAAEGTGSYTWLDRIWEFLNHKGLNK